jgi:hypothetical protein
MMKGVPKSLFARLLAAVLLAGAIAAGGVALAGTTSLEESLAGALLPSATPPLLGPITSSGRKGWDCLPERAAAAQHWQDAQLPSAPISP